MGDSGTLLLSYIFAFLFIKMYNLEFIKTSDEILLILLLPGLEIIRVFVERLISNKNILHGDRNHIHHLLTQKKKVNFLIIQFFLIFPYLFSLIFKNKMIIIILFSLLYLLTIIKAKKCKKN